MFMFTFFQTIFEKVTYAIVGIVVAIGLVSPATPPAIEIPVTTTTIEVVQKEIVATPPIKTEESDEKSLIQSLKKQIERLSERVKQSETKEDKTSEVTLANGAIVEVDTGGNIIRTIKEAPAVEMPHVPSQALPDTKDGQSDFQQQTRDSLQKIQQDIQQIQQNTTPPVTVIVQPPAPPPPTPPVEKSLLIEPYFGCQEAAQPFCPLKILYFENNVRKDAIATLQATGGTLATSTVIIKYYNAPDQKPYGLVYFYPDNSDVRGTDVREGGYAYYSVIATVGNASYTYSSRSIYYSE